MTTRSTTGVSRTVESGTHWLERHWLLMFNLLNGLVIAGAVLAPLLRAAGWTPLATLLYLAYRPLCPQRPDHSFFIAGYKMAFEQRETAIYLGLLLGGMLFAPLRGRLRPLNWRLLALLNLPMLIDVLSQTVGLRESTWHWRMLTGLLGSLAAAWWAYPHLERSFAAAVRARALADDARRMLADLARATPPPREDW